MDDNNYDPLMKQMAEALAKLKASAQLNEDDADQKQLVTNIQGLRSQLLDLAAFSYLNNPKNCKLLDAINTTLGQMEKSVRDERKEKERKIDKEENRATFKELLQALNHIDSGNAVIPEWEEGFFLDPNRPLTELDIGKIKDDEFKIGHISTDLDGNETK